MCSPASETPSVTLFHKSIQTRQGITFFQSLETFPHCDWRFYLVATLSVNQPASNQATIHEKRHHKWRHTTGRGTNRPCHMLRSTAGRNQTTAGGPQIIGELSWQNTEGVSQHLELILHTLQASLDLQRVVQHLHAAGVRVIPHREGTFDAGHVPPWQKYKSVIKHRK